MTFSLRNTPFDCCWHRLGLLVMRPSHGTYRAYSPTAIQRLCKLPRPRVSHPLKVAKGRICHLRRMAGSPAMVASFVGKILASVDDAHEGGHGGARCAVG